MRDFSIDILWSKIQMAVAGIGGWLGYFLGGMDGLMIALLVFMVLDYITGVMCAIADKRLSSSVGFKGICKKVLILMLVGLAHIVDMFLPASFVANASLAARYVVGVGCVSELLFFSAVIPCILSTKIPVKITDILIIWVERVIFSILLAGIVALVFL